MIETAVLLRQNTPLIGILSEPAAADRGDDAPADLARAGELAVEAAKSGEGEV